MTAALFKPSYRPEVEVVRDADARFLNSVLNHPEVRPWVAPMGDGAVDMSKHVGGPSNYVLMAEHGGCFLHCIQQPDIFEVHTQVLPEGRGEWAIKLVQAVQHYGFTRTPAKDCLTRVPVMNKAAKALTLKCGLRYEFTRPNETERMGVLQDVDVFSFRLMDWVAAAPGLEQIGREFHDWMHAEAERLGTSVPWHEDDPNHNRYVGACIEMALHGQTAKAVNLYNRWAAITRHPLVNLITSTPSSFPPVLRFDIGCLRVVGDSLMMFRDAKEAMEWAA